MTGYRTDPPVGPQGRADIEARSRFAPVPECPPWLSPGGRRLSPSNGPSDAPQARDALRQALRSVAPAVTDWVGLGPRGAAAWLRLWQSALAEVGGIESSRAKPYREHNFARCSGTRKQGSLSTHADGVTSWVPYRCGESLCPECADKIGDDLGRDYAEVMTAAAQAHGLRRLWFVVATIPRAFEHIPMPGSDEGRALRRGLARILRGAFGLRSRAQLPMYIATHAVGDRSLMRPRVHYHAGALPLVFEGDHVRAIRCRSLDVDALRQQWGDLLHLVFGVDPTVAQLHVSWVDPLRSPGKCHHRVRYDVRAFGADYRDAPLMWSPSTGVAVIREGDGWRVIHVIDLARQWAWARRQREVRPYGPLAYRRKCAVALGVEQYSEDVPPVVDETPAMAWCVRRKRLDPKTGRIRWVESITYWIDVPGGLAPVGGVEPARGGTHWRVRSTAPPQIAAPPPAPPPTLVQGSLFDGVVAYCA